MDDINLKLYLSDEEWFLDGITQLKNPDNCFDILNWYRNLYYKEDKNTEHGKMAWTINEVLMKLKELGIDLKSLSDEDKEVDNNKDDHKDKEHKNKNNDNEVLDKNNVTVIPANPTKNYKNNPKQKRKRGKRNVQVYETKTNRDEKTYVNVFKDKIIAVGNSENAGKEVELIR